MDRELIYAKYNGRCAYTGKPLGDNWQIDHCISKRINSHRELIEDVNNIANLIPALSIVNHYKRAFDLEGFRNYMMNFHKRLAKLPKHTNVPKTMNRIRYMQEVADAFNITIDKPFTGIFYFESI